MFLLEAMSNKCAVIGTDVGQVGELLQGVGLVVGPGSTDEFTTAMRQLLSDNDLRSRFAELGHLRIEQRHSGRVIAELFEDHWVGLAYGKEAS
ncbi:hypothetical protein ASG69_09840 [Rhodococcus sp. Leaf225]|nr:hypothetical protein ASG69_09840 [Rhodococcus sp. Leaf225]KQU46426.1 hypothetical protein ASH03_06875 [Rhodococcus sp. Leaf258]